MRYCKRTFFNVLFQPKRIGKAIFKRKQRHQFWGNVIPKKTMWRIRRSKTPRNLIIGRHSAVKTYKMRVINTIFVLGVRTKAQSIFVRRAKLYATT